MRFEFNINYGEAYKEYWDGITDTDTCNIVSDNLIDFLIDMYEAFDEVIYYTVSDCLEKIMTEGLCGKYKEAYYSGIIKNDDPAMDAKEYDNSEWTLTVEV